MLCPKCKEEKEPSMFSKNKSRKSGYNSWCKECIKQKVIDLVETRVKEPVEEQECITCHKVLKTVGNFSRHRRYKTGYYNICNECQKLNSKTPQKVAASWKKHEQKVLTPRINANIIKVFEILGDTCKDCNREATLDTFVAFDIHHLDPKQKRVEINAKNLKCIWKQDMEEELKNCVLLCACCHRLRHKRERAIG